VGKGEVAVFAAAELAGKPLVEEIHERLIVHGDMSIRDELLVLLHSQYPNEMMMADIIGSMDRRTAGAVRKQVSKLYKEKLVQRDTKRGYRLTSADSMAPLRWSLN
jgi:hypothetical protein